MRTVAVCGSGKYKVLVHSVCDALSRCGFVVFAPPLHNIDKLTETSPYEGKFLAWKGATFAHLNRILTAEICVMVNPEGYLGVSSTLELGYAVAQGKVVVAMNHDIGELARESMFSKVLETEDPELFAEKLKSMFFS